LVAVVFDLGSAVVLVVEVFFASGLVSGLCCVVAVVCVGLCGWVTTCWGLSVEWTGAGAAGVEATVVGVGSGAGWLAAVW
jgi:hypothetical protein